MRQSEVFARDRRLVILRLLVESRSANAYVLHVMLEQYGHRVSQDTVLADCAWLAEQGLGRIEMVADMVTVLHLTMRGEDIALGRAVHPGVKRPAPE